MEYLFELIFHGQRSIFVLLEVPGSFGQGDGSGIQLLTKQDTLLSRPSTVHIIQSIFAPGAWLPCIVFLDYHHVYGNGYCWGFGPENPRSVDSSKVVVVYLEHRI